jgi:hypothetical protein
MSAFKKLNRQDAFITSYTAKKEWRVLSENFEQEQISSFYGIQDTGSFFVNDPEFDKKVFFKSIKQLYYSNNVEISQETVFYSPFPYSNYISIEQFEDYVVFDYVVENYFTPSTLTTIPLGAFDNFYQSSLFTSTRFLEDRIYVLSIPKDKFGTHIEPESLLISYEQGSNTGQLVDNGEGKLVLQESTFAQDSIMVGDIIYAHGIIIITNTQIVDFLIQEDISLAVEWKSNLPILTATFTCKVSDYEFNFTQNPTATAGSNGELRDNVTGSYFQPYVTGIGLYNDANELIAVGKFGQPIPKTPHTDMTFVIKLDM